MIKRNEITGNANGDKNREEDIFKHTARLLVGAALDKETITYGEVATELGEFLDFKDDPIDISPQDMGFVATVIENIIYDFYGRDVPLLNILMVRDDDDKEKQVPGHGAGKGMGRRFKRPELCEEMADINHSKLWMDAFKFARKQVYAYRDWEKVYLDLFGEPWERP